MKYRKLTREELKGLEKQFVRFLAANTVTADDWERLKTDAPDKAEHLIELFSDLIFDKTLTEAEYLEYKTPKDIKTFYFLEEEVILNGLKVEGETELDFTQETATPELMLAHLRQTGAQLRLYTARKQYRQSREQEMFHLMEKGALISRDGKLFNTLEQLKKDSA